MCFRLRWSADSPKRLDSLLRAEHGDDVAGRFIAHVAVARRTKGPGCSGLESSMDKLAHYLGIDPVELRLRNEPDVDPRTRASCCALAASTPRLPRG